MKYKILLTAMSLAFIAILLIPSIALAGLRVGPTIIEREVSVGENTLPQINVGNTTDEPMDIRVEVKGYGQSLSGTTRALDEDTNPYTAVPYISVSPAEFHLEPNQSKIVQVTVDIPEGTNGGRYAVILVSTVPSPEAQIATVAAVAIATWLVIVPSYISRDGEITTIGVGEIRSGEPIPLLITVSNIGNVHYKVTGDVTVKDEWGNVLTTQSIPLSYTILPAYAQQLQVLWTPKTELPPAKYFIDATVTLEDGTILDSGSATFELVATYIPPAPPPKAIMWTPIIAGIICGLIAVGLLVYFLVIRRRAA